MAETKRKDQEWRDLYSWIEKEILNYDDNQHIQKKSVLIIRGLEAGQNVRNKKCEEYGNYSCEIVWLTFKANKTKILNAIRNKDFSGESNKVSYICAIVKDDINNVYDRYLNAQKSQEKIEQVNTDVMTYDGAEYKREENKNKSNKFDSLW